jgi:hypothetical protein
MKTIREIVLEARIVSLQRELDYHTRNTQRPDRFLEMPTTIVSLKEPLPNYTLPLMAQWEAKRDAGGGLSALGFCRAGHRGERGSKLTLQWFHAGVSYDREDACNVLAELHRRMTDELVEMYKDGRKGL